MQTKTTVALIQLKCQSSPTDNLQQAREQIRRAAEQGAQICCLPELFLGPYFCQSETTDHFALAEPIPGPTTTALSQLAAELKVVIVGSIFEKRTAGIYHNTATVHDIDGTLVGRYRKMHIPDDPQYYEKFYFTPGDLGFQSFATAYGRIGVIVCWDQWFPEAARLTAMNGAELILCPTAIGWFPQEKQQHGEAQLRSWQTIQQSHAIANGCFFAAVNRVGLEQHQSAGIEFWGSSFVCDCQGQIVASASQAEPETLLATIDTNQVEAMRTAWPFLRDRRIDAYDGLLARFCD